MMVFGHSPEELQLRAMVRELQGLERLHSEFGLRYGELALALSTSESTVHRWRRGRGGAPTPVYVKRLEALGAFLEELDSLFADHKVACAWLDKPLGVLKERSPRQLIVDGHVDRVTGLLYALNAGAML